MDRASIVRRQRATLGTGSGAHFVHDGVSDSLYVLFPVWAEALGLSHAQVGILKMVFSGAMAAFQVPAGFLAERWGERILLAVGTAVAGLGFILIGGADGFLAILICLFVTGLASGVQHPLASTVISRAYETGPRRAALGAYNFAGDLGKVAVPVAVAAGIATIGWRNSTMAYGLFGVVAGLAVFLALRRLQAGGPLVRTPAGSSDEPKNGWGIRNRRGFAALSAIGVIDSMARTSFLTFLPFLLIAKGAQVEAVGFALALVFAGGATGKLLCGLVAERVGIIRTVVITEIMTGAGILILVMLPLGWALVLLPVIGLALNGTSSVLYGTIADFTERERQSRAFGLFYTLGIGAGAVAPPLFGVVSDMAGVAAALSSVGIMVFLTLAFCQLLRASLATGKERS